MKALLDYINIDTILATAEVLTRELDQVPFEYWTETDRNGAASWEKNW
jgi:hypothetical protein